jgi:hypothetical protein
VAITLNGSSADLKGLSTDTKPTDVPVNTLFLELDTGCFFYFNGTEWAEVGGTSNG